MSTIKQKLHSFHVAFQEWDWGHKSWENYLLFKETGKIKMLCEYYFQAIYHLKIHQSLPNVEISFDFNAFIIKDNIYKQHIYIESLLNLSFLSSLFQPQ